jgi:hypothetical protein
MGFTPKTARDQALIPALKRRKEVHILPRKKAKIIDDLGKEGRNFSKRNGMAGEKSL